eukprot:jgi/Botrbrau1/20814/Bobra.0156s0042.1
MRSAWLRALIAAEVIWYAWGHCTLNSSGWQCLASSVRIESPTQTREPAVSYGETWSPYGTFIPFNDALINQKFQVCSNPEEPTVAMVEYYLPPIDGKRCCPIPEKAIVSFLGPGQAPTLWTFQIYDARKEQEISAGNSTTKSLESGWLDFQLMPNALDMDEEDSEHCGHYQLRIMRSSKPLEQGSCVTLRSSTMNFVCKARSSEPRPPRDSGLEVSGISNIARIDLLATSAFVEPQARQVLPRRESKLNPYASGMPVHGTQGHKTAMNSIPKRGAKELGGREEIRRVSDMGNWPVPGRTVARRALSASHKTGLKVLQPQALSPSHQWNMDAVVSSTQGQRAMAAAPAPTLLQLPDGQQGGQDKADEAEVRLPDPADFMNSSVRPFLRMWTQLPRPEQTAGQSLEATVQAQHFAVESSALNEAEDMSLKLRAAAPGGEIRPLQPSLSTSVSQSLGEGLPKTLKVSRTEPLLMPEPVNPALASPNGNAAYGSLGTPTAFVGSWLKASAPRSEQLLEPGGSDYSPISVPATRPDAIGNPLELAPLPMSDHLSLAPATAPVADSTSTLAIESQMHTGPTVMLPYTNRGPNLVFASDTDPKAASEVPAMEGSAVLRSLKLGPAPAPQLLLPTEGSPSLSKTASLSMAVDRALDHQMIGSPLNTLSSLHNSGSMHTFLGDDQQPQPLHDTDVKGNASSPSRMAPLLVTEENVAKAPTTAYQESTAVLSAESAPLKPHAPFPMHLVSRLPQIGVLNSPTGAPLTAKMAVEIPPSKTHTWLRVAQPPAMSSTAQSSSLVSQVFDVPFLPKLPVPVPEASYLTASEAAGPFATLPLSGPVSAGLPTKLVRENVLSLRHADWTPSPAPVVALPESPFQRAGEAFVPSPSEGMAVLDPPNTLAAENAFFTALTPSPSFTSFVAVAHLREGSYPHSRADLGQPPVSDAEFVTSPNTRSVASSSAEIDGPLNFSFADVLGGPLTLPGPDDMEASEDGDTGPPDLLPDGAAALSSPLNHRSAEPLPKLSESGLPLSYASQRTDPLELLGLPDLPRLPDMDAGVGASLRGKSFAAKHDNTEEHLQQGLHLLPAPAIKISPSTTWQWMQGSSPLSVNATVYVIDLFVAASAGSPVQALQAANRTVICYFSAGTLENHNGNPSLRRADYANFTGVRLGGKVQGMNNDAWLDITDIEQPNSKLAAALQWRIRLAQASRCNGILPLNVDAFSQQFSKPAIDIGLPITASQQLRFNRFISSTAHRHGLLVGLHNDGGQVLDLVNDFDFAVVEECFRYNECTAYSPFIAADKAVLEVEYQPWKVVKHSCLHATDMKFSVIKKGGMPDAQTTGYEATALPWCDCTSGCAA